MKSRGMYDRKGELFGYLVGTEIFDLDDTQKGYVRDGVIYAMNDERQFVIRGDALFSARDENIGYIGEGFRED